MSFAGIPGLTGGLLKTGEYEVTALWNPRSKTRVIFFSFCRAELYEKTDYWSEKFFLPRAMCNFAAPVFVDNTTGQYMADKTKIIFLADDDPEDQEILIDAITKLDAGVEMHKVDTGKQAVDFLLSCPEDELPCLIILDYSMPVFNAAEVLDHIRHKPVLQTIPKVIWSSSRQPEHVNPCMEKGAMSYFVKPNKMSELTEMVQQMLAICEKNYPSVTGK
jgi:CheY-like chemotaxis protein